MWVILTQDVTDSTGRFFVLSRRLQAKFAHGINDPALYRLHTIAHMRQCAIKNDVHGVIQVRILGVLFE